VIGEDDTVVPDSTVVAQTVAPAQSKKDVPETVKRPDESAVPTDGGPDVPCAGQVPPVKCSEIV